MSTMQINNMPNANELWKGIGGYFDTLGEILCEFEIIVFLISEAIHQ